MDIISLNNSNFTGLSANYPYDSNLKINQNIFFAEQNINIAVNNILQDINDNKINNFSNLFLTKLDNIDNNLNISPLARLEDEGFSTYFAANALGSFTPNSRFWVVEEPDIDTNLAGLVVSGISININNTYFFDIQLLTEKFCRVSHENNGIIRHLTVDYTGNLSFCKEMDLPLNEYNPQVFYYVYERQYDYFLLIKNINDICKFITFSSDNQELILVDPLTGATVPYATTSIFRVRPRNEEPNSTKLVDSWVSYKKDFKTNTLNVNENRSYSRIKSNLLVNNEYYNTNEINKALDVNILSLKNTNTPDNRQSRGNPFFNEDNIQFREFTSLFTGSNQSKGNDNISLNYETYTTSILLKKDKVTYFHVPQVFYPFVRLNINNSNLVNSGAIAGDHPLKADKIFKKKADYKYSSHFGETIEETTGSFLCSWLSGNMDVNSKPVWVDRYYNPKRSTFIKALSSSDYKAIKYISLFDCLTDKAAELLGDVEVFDKPSDLVFEPGTYYAYHHYGPKDVDNFIKTFSSYLVQNNFKQIYNTNGSSIRVNENEFEYNLDGSTFLVTNNLSSIQDTNQFTLVFDMFSKDWTKPIGYQILGNFNRDGFGIYNQNLVTPLVLFPGTSALYVANTDFKLLNKIELNGDIRGIIRLGGLNDIYTILSDSSIRRYNLSYSETRKITPSDNAKLNQTYDIDYDENDAYILLNNDTPPNVTTKVKRFNLKNNEIQDAINSTEDCILISNPNSRRTINVYNQKLYFTNGNKAERVGNTIFYKTDKSIRMWKSIDLPNITTDFVSFSASTSIDDFIIDMDQNLWILYDNYKYVKFTAQREFLLSGIISDNIYKNYRIFPLSEFENDELKKQVVIALQAQGSTDLKLIKLDNNGKNLSTTTFYALTSNLNNFSNSSYLTNFVYEKYPQSSFNFVAQLVNSFNLNDTTTTEIVFNLSALDPGFHNFAVRFDSYEGFMYLFVDGQIQGVSEFEPRKYKFSNLATRPFLIGTSSYTNGVPLYNYLKKPNLYMTNNLFLKNFYLYNKPLFDFDVTFHTKKGMKIHDIKFDIACGKRNYIEEIERYFKIDPPGSKSTLYNIVIRNTGINNAELRYALEQRILQIFNVSAPAYTKLNKFIWVN